MCEGVGVGVGWVWWVHQAPRLPPCPHPVPTLHASIFARRRGSGEERPRHAGHGGAEPPSKVSHSVALHQDSLPRGAFLPLPTPQL